MGKKYSKIKATLKIQLIIAIATVITLSIISVSILYFTGYKIFNSSFKLYENSNQQIQLHNRLASAILSQGKEVFRNRTMMDEMVKENDFDYQVIEINGNVLYGSTNHKIVNTEKDFYDSISQLRQQSSLTNWYEVIPIVDHNLIIGGVLISYSADIVKSNINIDWQLGILPFIFIILYSLIAVGILNRRIKKPMDELINVVDKIKHRDLNFEFTFNESNELGELAKAIDEMKTALKESLSAQWKIENDRKEMIRALAHDIRTPLTVISGSSELILEGEHGNNEKHKRYAESIMNNAERIIEYINDIDLSFELEEQGFEINPKPLNLFQFLNSKIQEYEIISQNKKINFQLDICNVAGNQHGEIVFDKERIERVLDNIVSNSIRHVEYNGKISIHVRIEDKSLYFEIRDNGCGFDSKDIPFLFDKFYKGKRTRKVGRINNGLGLYIAKQIVIKHEGSIQAKNTDYGGAIISFNIKTSF